MVIERVQTDDAIRDCFRVMAELRPHLEEAGFVARIREQMQGGYRLACVRLGDGVACVAGYRITLNLALGRHLYVDDLATREDFRSRGCGGRMMAWLRDEAAAEGCGALTLDSGVQRHRAHRFYLVQGMDIVCHHFQQNLAGSPRS